MSPAHHELAVSASDLHALRGAGSDLLDTQYALQRKGRSVLTELMGGRQRPDEWDHLPENDVFDAATGFRYYYHSHQGPGWRREHGHFHLFARAEGGTGVGPGFTHLLAVSLDASGMPVRGFTTNRWVTDDRWQPAARVERRLRLFHLSSPRRYALVSRWLSDLIQLFRPQIGWLLRERDRRAEEGLASRPNLFEDRRTTVLSECPFNLAHQFAWLERATPPARP